MSFINCSFFLISSGSLFFFFFNDTATTEIYTLSLHDALPIQVQRLAQLRALGGRGGAPVRQLVQDPRSEEHTSELQSRSDLVCRLLLEKKKKNFYTILSDKTKKKNLIY